ncbi:hypothetical protein D3870_09735 [Noviherbaspirillum cavernae]|uniref:Uncharacterized protein n=1 Tax=Noviherbaspirillum cavernae TaxID=2320862 RepID=A0A418X1C5_9BURK|nr:hypothetical protein [Noviherbaspirillum cavernae]RJG06254.1 hypothetical protein D3870_09735 [Noviherbaspirillum cavernae]
MKKVVVKFLKTVSPYQSGEIAGFDPEVAEKLIAEKKAVEYREPKKTGGPSKLTDPVDPADSSAPTDSSKPTDPADPVVNQQ